MDKPSGAFFETLGQYVYAYVDPETGKWLYTGKGNGDRCWTHTGDKNYDPEWCHIVARNLEKFEHKKDWQSFLLESYLIFDKDPADNNVSGHYKECFIMASLDFLFTQHADSQRDMFAEMSELVSENSDVFAGKLGFTESRQSTYYLETPMRENVYFGIKVQTKDPNITVILKANTDKFFAPLLNKVESNLGKTYKLDSTSTKNVISFPVKEMDEALMLWNSFFS